MVLICSGPGEGAERALYGCCLFDRPGMTLSSVANWGSEERRRGVVVRRRPGWGRLVRYQPRPLSSPSVRVRLRKRTTSEGDRVVDLGTRKGFRARRRVVDVYT